MRTHYLQHVPYEGLGSIADWLEEQYHTVSSTKFFEPDFVLPGLDEFDMLIIMGGPMNVYDEGEYPWLFKEKDFITDCINAGKKVLGICLGAQLVAVCLGGLVQPAPEKEIGWFAIEPTADCKQRAPWFAALIQQHPVVFHWHGDQFCIPRGAVDLATSKGNYNQAYLVENNILGLQFHLECLPQNISEMLKHPEADEAEGSFIQNPETIIEGVGHCLSMNLLMVGLLEKFMSL